MSSRLMEFCRVRLPLRSRILNFWGEMLRLRQRCASRGLLPSLTRAGDVRVRGKIESHPDQGDGVHRAVQLTVAASVQPALAGKTGGGRDRSDAGEGYEGCRLGAKPSPMRPADQDLSCGDRVNAE